MESYMAVLTKNQNLFKFVETIYYNVSLKLINDIESSLLDKNCLSIVWDLSSFTNLSQIEKSINKPIIIFSDLLNDYYSSFSLFSKLVDTNTTKSRKFNDLHRLHNDTFFSIEKHCIITQNSIQLLTSLEFRLLYYLLKIEGMAVSTDLLMEKLDLDSPSSLYVCIKKLRKKIEYNSTKPLLLLYHKNKGYYLNINNINKK
ncbi:helix-turn-helix domain-containing protein [Sutcliffiella sp. NPDC057660]|uniref:winged helix-turn-helix domain-containing protein n=1 Tax=Sutcliffiella sp. NPDC057660 TaxID=3346199 RepID=UPI0036B4EDA4